MYQKSIPMTLEHAIKILNDSLDIFESIFKIYPLRLSNSIENAITKTLTFKVMQKSTILEFSYFKPEPCCTVLSNGIIRNFPEDEYRLDIIYKYIQDNRYFEITLFDEPDDCGYCSMLPDYEPSTYVLCNIVEKRANGSKKTEVAFGFDIEKRTFLELFEVVHYNTTVILREYQNFNTPIEEVLKDAIII